MRVLPQAVTPLRGSCGVSVSGFEERGDANDHHQLRCWTQPPSCVSPPKGRRRKRRCCSQHRSSEHRGHDLLGVPPHIVHEEPPKRRLHCFPLLSAPPGRTHGWDTRRFESSPLHACSPSGEPASTANRRNLWPAHIHGPSCRLQVPTGDRQPGGRPSTHMERRVTVYAPIARISKVMARHGIDPGRKPRWIEDADAQHIARINEAAAAIRIR